MPMVSPLWRASLVEFRVPMLKIHYVLLLFLFDQLLSTEKLNNILS